MIFAYTAIDGKRRKKRGKVTASSVGAATKKLLHEGLFVQNIRPLGKSEQRLAGVQFGRVNDMTKALFVKHLATMLRSGITLQEALAVIIEQTTNRYFKNILAKINKDIVRGEQLAAALEKHPKIFDPLVVNIIRVGESSGTLEENLDYLATELEQQIDLKRRIKAASLYPTIVLIATVGLGFILAYFVFPRITRLFETLSFELPLATRILLYISNVMDAYGLYIFVGLIAGVIGLRILLTRRFAQPFSHRVLLRLPILGQIAINYNLTLFNRTLAILLRSGLTIDQALDATIDTTRNYVYRKMLKNILPKISKGQRFSEALSEVAPGRHYTYVPLLVIKMIGVGERSGRLDESFSYLSEYFGKEVDNATKNLTTTLEPILLLGIGLIVGFVAVSVILPIYQVVGQFRR